MTTLNLAEIVREGQAQQRGRAALENIAQKYSEKLAPKLPKKTSVHSELVRARLTHILGYTPSDTTIDFIVLHYL